MLETRKINTVSSEDFNSLMLRAFGAEVVNSTNELVTSNSTLSDNEYLYTDKHCN